MNRYRIYFYDSAHDSIGWTEVHASSFTTAVEEAFKDPCYSQNQLIHFLTVRLLPR